MPIAFARVKVGSYGDGYTVQSVSLKRVPDTCVFANYRRLRHRRLHHCFAVLDLARQTDGAGTVSGLSA